MIPMAAIQPTVTDCVCLTLSTMICKLLNKRHNLINKVKISLKSFCHFGHHYHYSLNDQSVRRISCGRLLRNAYGLYDMADQIFIVYPFRNNNFMNSTMRDLAILTRQEPYSRLQIGNGQLTAFPTMARRRRPHLLAIVFLAALCTITSYRKLRFSTASTDAPLSGFVVAYHFVPVATSPLLAEKKVERTLFINPTRSSRVLRPVLVALSSAKAPRTTNSPQQTAPT